MVVNISPLDVRKHEFRKTLRGYDPEEVMTFLDMVSIELENLVRDNASLKDRLGRVEAQLKNYHDIEGTLRETLLSAQRAREETINTAKKHSDVIIREAEVKAASIIEEGRSDLSRLRRAFIELKVQKDNYLVKIKAMINAQLEMLGNVDFREEKNLNELIEEPERPTMSRSGKREASLPEPPPAAPPIKIDETAEPSNPLDDPSFGVDDD
jgi:cell division initiation protein